MECLRTQGASQPNSLHLQTRKLEPGDAQASLESDDSSQDARPRPLSAALGSKTRYVDQEAQYLHLHGFCKICILRSCVPIFPYKETIFITNAKHNMLRDLLQA